MLWKKNHKIIIIYEHFFRALYFGTILCTPHFYWEMIAMWSAASLALQVVWESRKLSGLNPEAVLFNSTRRYQLAIKLIDLPCISY